MSKIAIKFDKVFSKAPTSVKDTFRDLVNKVSSLVLTNFYKKFIKKGFLVFDIGANIGDYSEMFLKMGANVVALEPQEYCLNILKERFKNNKNIELINKGAGSQIGKEKFYVSEKDHPTSTFSKRFVDEGIFSHREWGKEIVVDVVTLDSLIEKYAIPDFCKIDVEGYEFEVLNGLSHPIPLISFEYSIDTPDLTKNCLEKLKTLGNYEFNFRSGFYSGFKMKNWTSEVSELVEMIGNSRLSVSGDVFARLLEE